MAKAIDETERRRTIQEDYNKEHGITPKTIIKEVRDLIRITHAVEGLPEDAKLSEVYKEMTMEQRRASLDQMSLEMRQAAKDLNFEKAAEIRDLVLELKAQYKGL